MGRKIETKTPLKIRFKYIKYILLSKKLKFVFKDPMNEKTEVDINLSFEAASEYNA